MIKIHAIETGKVKVKLGQVEKLSNKVPPLLNVLFGSGWTEWLPIYAWLIEHPEGLFLVDTGETAKTSTDPTYLPRFHPYYRRAVQFDVAPADEIGPQLGLLGFSPDDVSDVIMTHLHTDHVGGIHHFPNSRIWVSEDEYLAASGAVGRLNGYLPHRWPAWFSPDFIRLQNEPYASFSQSKKLTADGKIVIVPTPGHTEHHLSVIVEDEDMRYFFAGDTSYYQRVMQEGKADGLSSEKGGQTISRIQELIKGRSTVYLPSHDPEAGQRLLNKQAVKL